MSYNSYYPSYSTSTPSMSEGAGIWLIVSFVVALIGCFVVYFIFVNKNDKLDNKKLAWLRSFLSFDTMLIEPMLKIGYIFAAILITLGSFSLIEQSFIVFLLVLIFGNLFARLVYEAALLKVMIWKNTTVIKNKLK